VSTWTCAVGARCATVACQIEPGQPRPGIKMTGRPAPETSTPNEVGVNAGAGLVASGAAAAPAALVAAGGGAPPHAATTRSMTSFFMGAPYARWGCAGARAGVRTSGHGRDRHATEAVRVNRATCVPPGERALSLPCAEDRAYRIGG